MSPVWERRSNLNAGSKYVLSNFKLLTFSWWFWDPDVSADF
jgi:hypothetical protein